MIEVEIRGNLSSTQYETMKCTLSERGEYIGSQDREMYLLRDYLGYSEDFATRTIDIRLRRTNGECEIMLKMKKGKDTTARREVSLKLKDTTLDNAKEIAKALGYSGGLCMYRISEQYRYHDIIWSLVRAPKNTNEDILYYEAEIEVEHEGDVQAIREKLIREARELGFEVLDENGTRKLIERLDREVNVWIKFD